MATKKFKIGNVPNLRFAEFEGEWVEKKLGAVTEIQSGFAFKSEYFSEEGIKLVIPKNFTKLGYGNFQNVISKFSNEQPPEKYKCSKGDLLVLLTDLTPSCELLGKPLLIKKEDGVVWLNQRIIRLNSKNDVVTSWLLFFLLTDNYHKIIKETASGSTVRHSSNSIIQNIDLSFPSLPEQQKIATFFSLIDDRISTQRKIIDRLESLIKGLSEELFSQKLRFKDANGKEFPKWEEKRFGEIYSFKVTNSFSRDNLNYNNGTIKNIHYGDIHTKFKTLFDINNESVPFINPEISTDKISKDNYCREGDVILADASEDLNDVGKSIELINLNNEKLLSGLHTILARPHLEKLSIGFGGYLFKSNFIRTKIQKEAQGSKVLSISTTRLSNIVINFPSIDEQIQIVNILYSIDKKIEIEKDLLLQYENQKKYFLTNLFI